MGARAIFQLETPYTEDEVFDLGFEQAADVMVLTHLNHQPQRLTRYDHDVWTLAAAAYLATSATPTSFAAGVAEQQPAGSPGYILTTYGYTVTAIDAITGQESLEAPGQTADTDLTLKGNMVHLTWDAVAGAERYNIYRAGGGSYGYIGTTTGLYFNDDNIAPDFSLSFPLHRDPFAGELDKPAAVAFWQQRAVYARTYNKPNGVFASQSGNLFNMNVARPLVDSDAAVFALTGRRVNAVMHLVPLKNLIAFTTDAIFSISGGGQNGVFTPTDIDVTPQGYRAASRVRPVVVDDVIFFHTARGASIRTLGYQFEADGYKGNDLTVFATHLFRDVVVVDMAWAEFPNNSLSVVASDGDIRLLTWQQEQDVWGWSKTHTDGDIESVCSVSEGGEDVTYYVVRRTVDGVARRYMEYSASPLWTDVAKANYLDCSRSYSGSPASTFYVPQLTGKTVSALADGDAYVDFAVVDENGFVTLPHPASDVTVGLSYESWIRTLPFSTDTRDIGTTKGIPSTVADATVSVIKSRGLEIGQGKDLPPGQFEPLTSDDEIAGDIDEIETRDLEAPGVPTSLFSGNLTAHLDTGDWRGASVVVRQRYPLPMMVTSITPNYVWGGE